MGDTEHSWTGSGPKVVVLGDSLTVSSRTELRASLADVSLKIAAHFGEGLAGGPISEAFDSHVMASAAAAYRVDPPEVLVVALGTNDAWLPELSVEDAIAGWEAITAEFDDACLVGVTATENAAANGYDREEAQQINEVIRARSHQVVEWAEVGTDPDLLKGDLIHLSAAGRALRTDLISSAVRECLRDPPSNHP